MLVYDRTKLRKVNIGVPLKLLMLKKPIEFMQVKEEVMCLPNSGKHKKPQN